MSFTAMMANHQNQTCRWSHSKSAQICGLMLVVFAANGFAQKLPEGCGELRVEGRFGPFDYRAERYVPETTYGSHRALLAIVEHAHFTPEVEAGIRGKSGTFAAGDLSYTLRAFPNHHRALISIANLGEKEKTDLPRGSAYTLECWFQRALAWRPDDGLVRLIYASHLTKVARKPEAKQQADLAAGEAGDNAFRHQSIGMVYLDMGEYDLALKHAHKAFELGLNISALKEQLQNAKKWSEPSESMSGSTPKTSP